MSGAAIGFGFVLWFFSFLAIGLWYGAAANRWAELKTSQGDLPDWSPGGTQDPYTTNPVRMAKGLYPAIRRSWREGHSPSPDPETELARVQMIRRYRLAGFFLVGGLSLPLAFWLMVKLPGALWSYLGVGALLLLTADYVVFALRAYAVVRMMIAYGNGDPVRGATLAWQGATLATFPGFLGLQLAIWPPT